MPRLSIVIVSGRCARELETTLVSVLENRPADCEIFAALGHDYDDPYQLDGEVRFVCTSRGKAGFAAAADVFDDCRGDVVHVLDAATQVSEGWADAALDHFDRDAHIGSVSPLVLDAGDSRNVLSAGLDYRRGGKPRPRRATLARSRICQSQARPEVVLGPTRVAAFYRREPLLAAVDCAGFVASDALADADVALSLAELGYLAVLEPRCLVLAPAADAKTPATVASGRAAEAVFWRHAAANGWAVSLLAHAATVAGETCAMLARPSLVKRLLGRLIGICELPRHLGHAGRLAKQFRPADDESPASLSVGFAPQLQAAPEQLLSPGAVRRAA